MLFVRQVGFILCQSQKGMEKCAAVYSLVLRNYNLKCKYMLNYFKAVNFLLSCCTYLTGYIFPTEASVPQFGGDLEVKVSWKEIQGLSQH